MASSVTEGSSVRTGMTWPWGEILKMAPVELVQNRDVPAPSVAAPVAQLDAPTGLTAPDSVTTRPVQVRTRCLGALSPPRTTVTLTLAGVALATAGMARVPARDAASTVTAAFAFRRINESLR